MKNTAAILLAGGKGTRMKSSLSKVLHPICGIPMLSYPLRLLKTLKIDPVVCIVGHGADMIRDTFACEKGLKFSLQEPQLGTGHAVMIASSSLKGFKGDVLILSGDVPLIRKETVKGLKKLHQKNKAAVSLVSALLEDPSGYGRIKRNERGVVEGIVEDKDASREERRIREINCGIYLVDSAFLKANIDNLTNDNAQGEYYLPDLIAMAVGKGLTVKALTIPDAGEARGINNRAELASIASTVRAGINRSLMLSGVSIIDPAATYIDALVKIGRDTVISPGVHLIGKTTIGAGVVIEENVRIKDSAIGAGSTVKCNSVVEESKVGKGVAIGPFARLRPGNVLKEGARIGNFVEVKNSNIGPGVKAGHLSYLGDSDISGGVNIGAGTITCNYDGKKKFRTVIKEGAFIGSDTQLIAPVTIGKGAYIGSGSTITKDVPDGVLALSRAEQKNLTGKKNPLKKEG